jgi:hypothetical protein
MNRSPHDVELALDRGIDEWISSRRGAPAGSPAVDIDLDAELTDDVNAEIEELVFLLDLVADASVPEQAGMAPDVPLQLEAPRTRREVNVRQVPWSLRVAASIVLVAALAVGLVAAVEGHRPTGSSPAHGGPQMPAQMLASLKSEADNAADPYPTEPILWLRTTLAKLRAVSGDAFPLYVELPASTPVWVADMRGTFYGDPGDKNDIFREFWNFYVAQPQATTGGVIGNLVGREWGDISDLSRLGTVHTVMLTAPATPPPYLPLPTSIAATLERDASANHEPYPPTPALFVETTAGAFRHIVGSRLTTQDWWSIATAAAATPVWIVEYEGGFQLGNPNGGSSTLWLLALGQTGAEQYSWLGNPPGLAAFGDRLGRFGPVHEAWIAPSAPTSLSPLVDDAVHSDLAERFQDDSAYLRQSRTIEGTWTETSVAALESLTRPQMLSTVSGIAGNAPVWVVELTGLPATTDSQSHSDWVIVTTQRPDSSSVVSDTSLGVPPLFGITSLSQIGTVRAVTFHVTAGDGHVTFSGS